jgi:hypothetical protein
MYSRIPAIALNKYHIDDGSLIISEVPASEVEQVTPNAALA